MVLDLTCDDLHRPAAYRFVCPDTTASPNALQRYNIFLLVPNFGRLIGAIFSTNLTNLNEP